MYLRHTEAYNWIAVENVKLNRISWENSNVELAYRDSFENQKLSTITYVHLNVKTIPSESDWELFCTFTLSDSGFFYVEQEQGLVIYMHGRVLETHERQNRLLFAVQSLFSVLMYYMNFHGFYYTQFILHKGKKMPFSSKLVFETDLFRFVSLFN